MRKLWLAGFVLSTFFMSGLLATSAHAASLRVQPLSYEETLQKGEKKKGFIDVTNPTAQTVNLKTSVQGFRQIDNEGSLQLYNSEQITAGIIPDLKQFSLKAGQTMRLVFLVDGTKLPEGDVFAALMVTNAPDQTGNMAQAVQVGTLLLLENVTPGARQAEVTELSVPFFQFGNTVTGSYKVKNTAPSDSASGFKPKVKLSLNPFSLSKEQTSTLIFAGRERSNQFELSTQRLGFYRVSASFGNSTQSKWVFIASPLWLGGAVLLLAVAGGLLLRRKRQNSVAFMPK